MAQPILVRAGSGGWREPSVTAYSNERELQDLVVKSPELLTGEPLATVDEFWIPEIGYVDIVGIGAEGDINIVECKLRANPEIRREVVGQLLAYAGGLWQMSYEQLASTWEARNSSSLLSDVRKATGTEDDDETIRRKVTASLDAGAFTLVIAVDEITDELKRIIEYLNAATKDDVKVLGLELQYVKDDSTEILIPRTYGEGLKKVATTVTATKWNAERFAEAVEALDEDQRVVVRALMDHGHAHGKPWWGSAEAPGMSWYYDVRGSKLSLFLIQLKATGALVTPSIGGLASSAAGVDTALNLLEELRRFEPFVPHLAHLNERDLNRYPAIPVIGGLAEPGGVEAFLAAIDRARGAVE